MEGRGRRYEERRKEEEGMRNEGGRRNKGGGMRKEDRERGISKVTKRRSTKGHREYSV